MMMYATSRVKAPIMAIPRCPNFSWTTWTSRAETMKPTTGVTKTNDTTV